MATVPAVPSYPHLALVLPSKFVTNDLFSLVMHAGVAHMPRPIGPSVRKWTHIILGMKQIHDYEWLHHTFATWVEQ